ncbi:MAG TPA: 23S rRNA (adenine(2503)-C(2))-methyltransferase RlmN [Solirubrobacterales bacterium]|nr:23S rRNA (adenine(2503)-C(2))-methyltransferase RlmN [Solirubrobacterales bacterium]
MDLAQLDSWLAERGEPAYRGQQIWRWLAGGADSFEQMTDLPAGLRAALGEELALSTLGERARHRSADGTEKVLMETADGRPLEAVLMRYRDGRRSLCLSSQSGCPLTCTFCATGTMKFGRNLTESEILDQALCFRRDGGVNHAVFMGMGEPMMNLDAVLAACERLPDMGISHAHTTVSTVGWLPGIERMAREGPAVRLALSLHAPEDALRSELMPVNDRYPLAEVLAACREWRRVRRRKVFIEYLMLDGVNDRVEQATQLAELLAPGGRGAGGGAGGVRGGGVRGRAVARRSDDFKVNLIPYNPTGERYGGSSRAAIDAFREALLARGVPATVRLTRGRDIDAACGQLAATAA